jgi:hypothetical protein
MLDERPYKRHCIYNSTTGTRKTCMQRAVLANERSNETRFTVQVLFMTRLGLGSSDYTVKGLFAPVTHPFFALSHSKPLYKPR